MSYTNFSATRNGFHFPNAFVNKISGITFGGGRCGGMAFASLDYYANSLPVPNCVTSDFAGKVPPDNTPLADYIMARLFDTFALYGNAVFNWCNAPDGGVATSNASSNSMSGVVGATKLQEWPKLKGYLDRGTPVTLQLITTSGSGVGALSGCHQVVATGYTLGANLVTIHIYDNNLNDDDTVTMASTLDDTNPHWNESNSGSSNFEIWRGFFVEDGTQPAYRGGVITANPPAGGGKVPPLVDLVVSGNVLPSPSPAETGQPFGAGLSIRNAGPYPAHVSSFYLNTLLQGGAAVDAIIAAEAAFGQVLGDMSGTPVILQPGQVFSNEKSTQNLSVPVGTYIIQAGYMNINGEWIFPPAASGISNSADIDVVRGPYLVVGVESETPYQSGGSGGYTVTLGANAGPSGFSPVAYSWTLDAGAATQQTVSGNPVTFSIPLGSPQAGFVYTHQVSVAATDASGAQASSTYTLTFTQPSCQIVAEYGGSGSVVAAGSSKTQGYLRQQSQAYSSVLVEASSSGLFAPLNYYWNPPPQQVLPGGSQAVFQMQASGDPSQVSSYQGEQVSLQVTDSVGQSVQTQAYVSAVVTSGGYVGPHMVNFNPNDFVAQTGPVDKMGLGTQLIDPYAYTVAPGTVQVGLKMAQVGSLPSGAVAMKGLSTGGLAKAVGAVHAVAASAAPRTALRRAPATP